MDAAHQNIKKFALFLAGTLLLATPVTGFAQATLVPNTNSVTIGSSSCNDFQNVQLTSSDGSNLAFTAAIQYATGNPFGAWLYTNVAGSGSTNNSTPFTANTGTGNTGVSLTIGLNSSIGLQTPTATVVLTPTNGTAVVNITVYYTQNSTCGGNTGELTNNFINVTPGNVALTAGLGGTNSQVLSLQSLVPTSMTFGYSVQPSGQWLSATANATTISPNGTTPITVIGDATKVSTTGTYSGFVTIIPAVGFGNTITVPVTFVVTNGTVGGGGSGSGNNTGTLTLNGATNNTYATTFSQVGGNAPGGQCIPIQDTAAGASSYTYQVSTNSGGNWLLANYNVSGTTTGLIGPSNAACVNLTLANISTSLQSGVYTGQVALTSSSGSTASITVTLYVSGGTAPGVSIAPGSVYSYTNVAVGSTALQQQVFSFTVQNGYLLGTASQTGTAGCPASATWFTMSIPTAIGNTESFTGTANPTGLQAGVYCTAVTMQSTGTGGNSGGTSSILIILPVGQGAGGLGGSGGSTGSAAVVGPTALQFQQQSGSTFWTGGKLAQTVTLTGQQGTNWSAGIIYAGSATNWLNIDSPSSASGTFGSGPTSLVINLFNGVNSLPPSSTPYTATVSITTPGGTSTVGVSLLVTAANTPVMFGLPSISTFTALAGALTSTQVAQVVGSDNTASGTSPIITVGTPTVAWATATSSLNSMTISVNGAGLSTGIYFGTIPVTAPAYSNTLNYPIVLVVNGGGGGASSGALTLSTTALSYTNVTGQISQSINMTAASSTNVTASILESSCTNVSWLSASPIGQLTASQVNTPITVLVNPAGIGNGTTCTGVLNLATSTSTQTVTVSMGVGTTTTTTGNVTVSPTSMTFGYTQGQTVPAAQTATILNATGVTGNIPYSVATAEQSGTSTTWLQVNATSGTTPANSPGLSVSVVPGSLGAGTYQGTVTISPTGGTAQVINITLNVASSSTVTATPTTLSLSYTVGATSPTATIQVSGGGSASAFTATAASASNWLTVSPGSGTTPNTGTFNLTVGLNSTVLGTLLPGPYTGTITVAGTSPATGTTIVNVSLTVTAPLPTITGITNGASSTTGPLSPGEVISIYANASNPIGPSLPVGTTLDSTGKVSTSLGGVTVTFLPVGIQAPLTYVSAGQINCVVPYGVVGGGTNMSVEVKYLGQTSNAFPVTLATTAPGIFTVNFGTGQAAALQYDNLGNYKGINSVSNPAARGWYLVLYMTGEGVLNPQPATGAVTGNTGIPVPFVAPNVLIDNNPATVAAYSEAPGLVSGVLQVNTVVPAGAHSGPVSLVVSLGNNSSQQNVTVAVQ